MNGAQSGPFACHYARLIEHGYRPVPIIPGSKRPGVFEAGTWQGLRGWSTRVPTAAELARWARHGSGIGVVCGPASRDLVGIDIDTDNEAIVAALLAVLPPTSCRKMGARGETWFYHGPGIASRSWDIDRTRIVEIIAGGRQTVLPPTIHPGTRAPYRWIGDEQLDALAPDALPMLPADIADRITAVLVPFGYEPARDRTAGRNDSDGNGAGEGGDAAGESLWEDDSPHRNLNDAAIANLSAWVPMLGLYRCRPARGGYEAVATWRPSSTGRPDEVRKRNLSINPKGISDFGTGQTYTPLDLVMAACDCDLDTAFGFLADQVWPSSVSIDVEGILETQAKASETATARVEVLAEPGPSISQQQGAPGQLDDQSAAAAKANVLEPYTHVPGALGDIVEWIIGTARRPNRVLALGAAIVTIGTLIGRRVMGPTGSSTTIYLVTIAPAASGKDHPLCCIPHLMKSAGAESHVHLGGIASQSGFQRVTTEMPLSVVIIDEIAGFLRRITSPRASEWERTVTNCLREQWGRGFRTIGTQTRAGGLSTTVHCPAISLYGTSTNVDFWSVLQGEQVENGLFSRFLVLDSWLRAPDREPLTDSFEVPTLLATRLRELFEWGKGPLGTAQLNDPAIVFNPHRLCWDGGLTGAAYECFRDLERDTEQQIADDYSRQEYLGRLVETAARLATIRAAGRRGVRAQVDVADMEWGAAVASTAIQAMMEQSQDCLPQTVKGRFAEKLVSIIRRRGPMTLRQLQRTVASRITSRELADVLRQQIEAGTLAKTKDGYRGT